MPDELLVEQEGGGGDDSTAIAARMKALAKRAGVPAEDDSSALATRMRSLAGKAGIDPGGDVDLGTPPVAPIRLAPVVVSPSPARVGAEAAAERIRATYGRAPVQVTTETTPEKTATVAVGRPLRGRQRVIDALTEAKDVEGLGRLAGDPNMAERIDNRLAMARSHDGVTLAAKPPTFGEVAVGTTLDAIAHPIIGAAANASTEKHLEEYAQGGGQIEPWKANLLGALAAGGEVAGVHAIGVGLRGAAALKAGLGTETSQVGRGFAARGAARTAQAAAEAAGGAAPSLPEAMAQFPQALNATAATRAGALKAIEDVAARAQVHPSRVAKLLEGAVGALRARGPGLAEAARSGAEQAVGGAIVGGVSAAAQGQRDPIDIAKTVGESAAQWGLLGGALGALSAEAQYQAAYKSVTQGLERSPDLADVVASERMARAPGEPGERYEPGAEQTAMVRTNGRAAAPPVPETVDQTLAKRMQELAPKVPEPAPAPATVGAEAAPAQAETPAAVSSVSSESIESKPSAVSAPDERTAPDLFGETKPKTVEQGSLLSEKAGTEASRPLANTDRAARAELEQLRQRLDAKPSPEERMQISARMADLERLVNRDQAIGADEMAHRASGEAAPAPPTAANAPKAIDFRPKADEPLPTHLDTPKVRAALKRAAEIPETNTIDTPERHALRQREADAMAHATRFDRRADVVMGLPGAGKTSTVVNRLVAEHGAANLDTDAFKAHAPEWESGLAAGSLHREAVAVRQAALDAATERGANLVFPTVGNPIDTPRIVQRLQKQGYTVHLHHVDVPPMLAAERVVQGFERGDRHFVSPASILERGDEPRRAYAAAAELPGVIAHDPIDNAVPHGTPGRAIADWRSEWGLDGDSPVAEEHPASPGDGSGRRAGDHPDVRRAGGTQSEGEGAGAGVVEQGPAAENAPPNAPSKRPAPRALKRPGTIVDDDGVQRFEHARGPSGGRRPVTSVSTRGLLKELLDLETKRAAAGDRSIYELRDDPNFHTSGIPQIVSTKMSGGGPSRQAKAQHNLDDFARITDEVHAELARRMPADDIWSRVEDLRAELDERAGQEGEYDPRRVDRETVSDAHGKVLFSRDGSGGGSTERPATAAPPRPAEAEEPVGSAADATSAASATAPEEIPTPAPSGLSHERPAIRPREALREVRALLNPETLGIEARGAAGTIRHEAARSFRELTVANEALRDFGKRVGKLSRADAVKYWDAAEHGRSTGDPEMDAGNHLLHEITQQFTDELIASGRLKAERAMEYYIGRFWSAPTDQAGRDFLSTIFSKRPLQGPKSFLKQRSIERFTDGLKAGLVPATYNYVDAQLAKIGEMQRLIAADRMLAQETLRGRAKKVLDTMGHEPPVDAEGEKWVRIGQHEDPAFTIYGPPTVTTKESYDAAIREGLEAAIARLKGVRHLRKVSTGMRGALGFAKGDSEIVSKFGTHDGVIMHELGHILDARYGLRDRLGADVRTVKELADLARLRYEGNDRATEKFKKYVQEPEEQVANALHALLHAPETMEEVAPTAKRILVDVLDSKPELKPILDIRPGLRLDTASADVRVPGYSVVGHWYAPRNAAAVWNAHLSKGIRGKALTDMYMAPAQAAAQLMLGVSGFHATVIATEGIFSDLALAIDSLANKGGKAALAPGQIASAIAAPVSTARLGRRVMMEFRRPGTHPELAKVLDQMIAGGYRGTSASELWTGEQKTKLRKAFEDAVQGESAGRRLWGAARLPFDALFSGVELLSSPIMAKYVPWMKTGATYRAVAREIEKLPPGSSLDQVHRVMSDVVKEMDYRFGQVIYDNHFINRFAKDLAQMAFLAPGWTFGTLTLMGRGAGDIASPIGEGARRLLGRATVPESDGVPPELVGRSAAYWIGAVLGTMAINGILTYAMTGEEPSGKDYFAFRDGTMDRDGNPNRHTIPGYLMHDVYGWTHHPAKTFKNKLSPVLSFMDRAVENRTYFGDLIRDPDAPVLTQVKEIGAEAIKSVAPISAQNFMESRERGETGPGEVARNLFGVGPAKREFVRTAAQNKMAEYLALRGHTARTPDQVETSEAKVEVRAGVRDKTVSRDSVRKLVRGGELTKQQASKALADAKQNPLLLKFRQLDPKEAETVYNLGTPEERAIWERAMRKKARQLRRLRRSDTPDE